MRRKPGEVKASSSPKTLLFTCSSTALPGCWRESFYSQMPRIPLSSSASHPLLQRSDPASHIPGISTFPLFHHAVTVSLNNIIKHRYYGSFPGDFHGGSDGKESACNAGDQGSIPGSGRSPGEGDGNPLQYSSLENSMNRRAWRATVLESWT